MKQSVNLYLPEFRKKKDSLSAPRMLQFAGLALVLALLFGGWEYWRLEQARAELDTANERRTAAVNATNALRARFGSQSPSEALQEQIALLEEDLNAKEAILEFINGRDMGNAEGFSRYMVDLARYHTEGLSLSAINLTSNGSSARFDGAVLRAELVPRFFENLSQSESFAGMSFETLNIEQVSLSAPAESGAPDMQALKFSVSTTE